MRPCSQYQSFVSLDNPERGVSLSTQRKAARAERGSGGGGGGGAAAAAAAEDTAGTEAVAKPTFADDSGSTETRNDSRQA